MKDVVRYDGLFSKPEIAILFCGEEKSAATIDDAVRRFNSEVRLRSFKKAANRCDLMKKENFSAEDIPYSESVPSRATRVYTIDLPYWTRNHDNRSAYGQNINLYFQIAMREIQEFMGIPLSGMDIRQGLPSPIKAHDLIEAERCIDQTIETLRSSLAGYPLFRDQELFNHLSAMIVLSADNKPEGVFPLTLLKKRWYNHGIYPSV